MAGSLAYQLRKGVQQVGTQVGTMSYRLVILVGPRGCGKTHVLQELESQKGWPRISVNQVLSEQLLELTARQRAVRLPSILGEVVEAAGSDVVLLDNIEMLFNPDFGQDPLRLLQRFARNRTIVAAWTGTGDGHCLSYAQPEHREWKKYDAPDALMVSAIGDSEER